MRLALAAALAASLLLPAAARSETVLRVGMTAADIPATTGAPDQGAEGWRTAGTTMYDSLVQWDLSSADKPSTLKPDLATDWAVDPANPRRVGEYSQGMKQRTALARVLLTQPSLLLLDEPFSNLDVASAHSMIARLQAWLAEPAPDSMARTLILTTHQAELARPLARITLTLGAGQLVSQEGA